MVSCNYTVDKLSYQLIIKVMTTQKKRWVIALDGDFEMPVKLHALKQGNKIITTISNLIGVAIATDWKILQVDQQKLVDWLNEQ